MSAEEEENAAELKIGDGEWDLPSSPVTTCNLFIYLFVDLSYSICYFLKNFCFSSAMHWWIIVWYKFTAKFILYHLLPALFYIICFTSLWLSSASCLIVRLIFVCIDMDFISLFIKLDFFLSFSLTFFFNSILQKKILVFFSVWLGWIPRCWWKILTECKYHEYLRWNKRE